MIPVSFLLSSAGSGFRRSAHAATLFHRFLALAALAFACTPILFAQTNEWVWMGGQTYMDPFTYSFATSVIGTQGVPSVLNFPASRYSAATWTDNNGNFWLFGGSGFDADFSSGALNDLWKYNPSTHEWAWITGSPKPANDCVPELWMSNGLEYGTYACGQPGVYGEMGVAAPANTPGSRINAVSWTDKKGRLWLFGGQGYEPGVGTGFFNDLWMFDPSSEMWTWEGGSPTIPGYSLAPYGVYGNQGVAAPANYPGGRYNAAGCVDPSGNFWLFGGYGGLASADTYNLNDLWKFNPSTGQWIWMSGSSTPVSYGSYGNQGSPSTANYPGPRTNSACWFDKSGKLWLFGGNGMSINPWQQYLNDLWQFNPATRAWAWMAGSNQGDQGGTYGTRGVAAVGNIPSARYESMIWTDSAGRFWLFGGRGVDSTENWGDMNDLWMIDPTTLKAEWVTGSKINNGWWFGIPGVAGTLGIPAPANTPGAKELAAAWTDAQGNFWLFAGEGVDVNNDSWGMEANDLWKFQMSAPPSQKTPTPSILPAAGSYTKPQQVSIKDANSTAVIYYSTSAAGAYAEWFPYTGPFPFTASETVSALAVAPGLAFSSVASAAYKMPAAAPVFNMPSGTYAEVTVELSCSTPGAVIHYTTNGTTPSSSSAVYAGQLEVTKSETINAVAIATGYLNSSMATATYTISSAVPPPIWNQWIWKGGKSTMVNGGNPGNYGKIGVAASTNLPGARDEATAWTDLNGNLWLFGGGGDDSAGTLGSLNDMWEFNPSTQQWTWFTGSSTIDTTTYRTPGVYGTKGKFAAGNTPGGRVSASGWMDGHGNLWLFGGVGFDANGNNTNLNDLWEFNPASRQWAWIAGPSVTTCPGSTYGGCTQRSNFGAFGAFTPANAPGGREEATSWTDSQGNLWLFGGSGIDSVGGYGELNELWEFNPAIQQWAWMGGDQTVGPDYAQSGVYGELGIPDVYNSPGGRDLALGWTGTAGNLWLFGGYGADAIGATGNLNDLWEFNPRTFEWAWMTGASSFGTGSSYRGSASLPGDYGILGVPAPGNTPGGRESAAEWRDTAGNLWLFGGYGYDRTGNSAWLNDLWVFSPSTHLWAWMGGSSINPLDSYGVYYTAGSYGTLNASVAGDVPGSRDNSVSWRDSQGNLWLFGGWGSDSNGTLGYLNDLWEFKPVAPSAPTAAPVFSLPTGWYTTAQTVAISDATPNAKIYYTLNGTAPTTGSTLYAGPLHINQTTVIEAMAVAPGHTQSAAVLEIYIIYP